jgi:hypothetical protein
MSKNSKKVKNITLIITDNKHCRLCQNLNIPVCMKHIKFKPSIHHGKAR